MKLRHLRIRNFRGIQSMDWMLTGDFVCLVGPGDSGKSTILDAIELVLSRRWNPVFDDTDFHNGIVTSPIEIEATLGDLPARLVSDAGFGLRLRGIGGTPPVIHDEPDDGDELVITIRLLVDSSLEPEWRVVTARHADGAPIPTGERERIGLTRLGSFLERDLSWKRGSILSRLTGNQDEHAEILAAAERVARGSVAAASLPKMSEAAKKAQELAARLGVAPRSGFLPALDPAGAVGAAGLSLHDGPVPVRRAGLGTRRLLTLAMQRGLLEGGGLVLVDEVENGLEPFRLRRLLRELLSRSDAPPDCDRPGTVLLTTHSPIALAQLRCGNIGIVRSDGGVTTVTTPSIGLQGTLVAHSEAFLSRKVIVCEGVTELGIVWGLDSAWAREGRSLLAECGVGLANAGGVSRVAEVAIGMKSLGYDVSVLADSDAEMTVSASQLTQEGIGVFVWSGQVCTEERLFSDLPWAAVAQLVEIAIDAEFPVKEQVATQLNASPKDFDMPPEAWNLVFDEALVRSALARAAKPKSGWFKTHTQAVRVGEAICAQLAEVPASDAATKIEALRQWMRR